MILDAGWRFARRFAAAARSAPPGPLADFYAAGLPDMKAAPGDMVAIDLETDGLTSASDSIIEAGLVGMTTSAITLATARRHRMRPRRALTGDSVIVHRITDDALAGAETEAEGLAKILPQLAGKAIVAHFAPIEMAFLDAACRRVYGAPFVAPFICTFQLEQRWFPASHRTNELRLGHVRRAYHLPDYTAHDGLIDAIACGELLLAQIARRGQHDLPLASLLRR
jgi:DNA polymerase III subunit epsilon